jgi:hypothetical protein
MRKEGKKKSRNFLPAYTIAVLEEAYHYCTIFVNEEEENKKVFFAKSLS